jgi:cyclin-D1-binding protein 1
LRLTTLLHKRILLDLLNPSTSPSWPSTKNPLLDGLLLHSTSLLTSTDDLISTLYIPHNPTSIQTELTTFIDIIRALQSSLISAGFFTVGLEGQLEQMSIQEGDGKGKKKTGKDIKKWFDTCFEQIYKAATLFASALAKDNDDICLGAS